MRSFIPFLVVTVVGCSDPGSSPTNVKPGDAATPDVSTAPGDASSSNDGGTASDASDGPVDMAGDAAAPPPDMRQSDAAPSDAATADAATTSDVGTAPDADASDAGSTDAGTLDMSAFVCPPAMYNGQICPQVIVYVRDQDSGTCCQYPTPCHIPEGDWGDVTYNSLAECDPT